MLNLSALSLTPALIGGEVGEPHVVGEPAAADAIIGAGPFAAWLALAVAPPPEVPSVEDGGSAAALAVAPIALPEPVQAGASLPAAGGIMPAVLAAKPQALVPPSTPVPLRAIPADGVPLEPGSTPDGVPKEPVLGAATGDAAARSPAPAGALLRGMAANVIGLERGPASGHATIESGASLGALVTAAHAPSGPVADMPTPIPAALAGNTVERPMIGAALGQQLVSMVRHGTRDARLHVHPADLGAVDIQLKLDGDSAQLALSCTHPAVRDALESAVPRLRELLGDVGLNLAHVDVEARDRHGHAGGFAGTEGESVEIPPEDGGDHGAPTRARAAVGVGLVDTFA